MKVRTTDNYKKLKVKDKELGCIPEAGVEIEISEGRFKILHGENKYGAIFVEEILEEVEVAKKKPKTEKAVKKTTKKSK